MRLNKIGFSTIALYGCLFYIPQFLLHLSHPTIFDERFDRFDTFPHALFIPIFFICLFSLRYTPIEKPFLAVVHRLRLHRFFENQRLLWPIALFHVVASHAIFKEYGVGIRFREEGLRSTGPLVVLAFFTASYARIWILYQYFRILKGSTLERSTRILAALFGLGLGLAFNGSLDVVDLLAASFLVIFPSHKIYSLLIKKENAPRVRGRIKFRTLLLVTLLPLLVVGIIYAGFVNKMGVDGVSEMTDEIGYLGIFQSTVVRASTSYFSTIAFVSKRLYDFEFYREIYSVPWDRFWYRLSLIFSPEQPLDRPEVLNVNRLNLINYLSVADARQLGVVGGASPGMVASGFFLAPFPLGIVLMAFFVILIARLTNQNFKGNLEKVSWVFAFFLLMYFDTIFASPLDLLAIDPISAYAIFFMIALMAGVHHTSTANGAREARRKGCES